MASIKKYNGSTFVDAAIRKYSTASEIITPPTTIYTDGSNITAYKIKGNTVQNGTPTPANPVPVVGVGELETTGEHTGEYKIPISNGQQTTNIYLGSTQTVRQIKKVVFDGTEDWQGADNTASKYLANITDYKVDSEITCMSTHYSGANNIVSGDLIPNNSACFYRAEYPRYFYLKGSEPITLADFKAYLAQQYANGTPVTVWYILETETTGVVNEPLRKIGDYADTVSGITIPTITGKDTVDVETTLKPSEVELTYTGWHDTSVKEKSRNLFNINAKDINNGYIDNANLKQDGTTETWSPCEVTEYIELVPNVSYRLSNIGSYNSLAYCIYDENKQYITGEQYSGQPVKVINMPPNGKYVRFSHFKTITETMLNEGSTALPYEPYWK